MGISWEYRGNIATRCGGTVVAVPWLSVVGMSWKCLDALSSERHGSAMGTSWLSIVGTW